MNFYPETIQAVVAAINALNELDKKLDEISTDDGMPYLAAVKLTDSHGTDFGTLRDEIGGSWSWFPPEPVALAENVAPPGQKGESR
jgi:hypothetical protein